MTPIALVGIGKIARDQHVPAIAGSADWRLAATVSRSGRVEGTPAYTSIAEMLAAHPEVTTISLCLPPVPRFEAAAEAIAAGRHVMLEKPPGATLAEVHRLAGMARAAGVTLYATWHSRAAPAVEAARAALAGSLVSRAQITWRESVRRWHPNQDWIWEPGGMGVLDPGINALSILTHILPEPVHLTGATLEVPENHQTPIAAQLTFTGGVTAEMDWREEGSQIWEIAVETDRGHLRLRDGGARGTWAGEALAEAPLGEYPALYVRMADLVREGSGDVDLAPMVHVSDAMTLGRRVRVAPFHW